MWPEDLMFFSSYRKYTFAALCVKFARGTNLLYYKHSVVGIFQSWWVEVYPLTIFFFYFFQSFHRISILEINLWPGEFDPVFILSWINCLHFLCLLSAVLKEACMSWWSAPAISITPPCFSNVSVFSHLPLILPQILLLLLFSLSFSLCFC